MMVKQQMDGVDIDAIYLVREGAICTPVTTQQGTGRYRLCKRGEDYVLQQAYQWRCGSNGGIEWQDEETIEQ